MYDGGVLPYDIDRVYRKDIRTRPTWKSRTRKHISFRPAVQGPFKLLWSVVRAQRWAQNRWMESLSGTGRTAKPASVYVRMVEMMALRRDRIWDRIIDSSHGSSD